MRATCEAHAGADGFVDRDAMPPIRVVIADDEANEDIAIKARAAPIELPSIRSVAPRSTTNPPLVAGVWAALWNGRRSPSRRTTSPRLAAATPRAASSSSSSSFSSSSCGRQVSDEGGGIKRSNMPRVWSYLFTTADPNVQRGFISSQGGADLGSGAATSISGAGGADAGGACSRGGGAAAAARPRDRYNCTAVGGLVETRVAEARRAVLSSCVDLWVPFVPPPGALAGLGYGLPISRCYARYFGGELDIKSMEGFGTDAFVHLSRLGNHGEPLPY